jgi:hypothetical protein
MQSAKSTSYNQGQFSISVIRARPVWGEERVCGVNLQRKKCSNEGTPTPLHNQGQISISVVQTNLKDVRAKRAPRVWGGNPRESRLERGNTSQQKEDSNVKSSVLLKMHTPASYTFVCLRVSPDVLPKMSMKRDWPVN